MQTKETALNARRKMGNYLKDENEAKTSAAPGVRQVRKTLEGETTKALLFKKKSGGSDET